MNARYANIDWVIELTGMSRYQIRRLAQKKVIPGAFQSRPGYQGSLWMFNKAAVQHWFEELTGLKNANTPETTPAR